MGRDLGVKPDKRRFIFKLCYGAQKCVLKTKLKKDFLEF